VSNLFGTKAAVLTVTVLLGGCGLFGGGDRRESYLDADAGKPLQVPAELDAPDRRDSTRVPEIAGEVVDISEAPTAALPVDADDPQSRIKMRMTPDEAFAKVREALEQAQIATVGEADAESRRVTLEFNVTEERKRWWWKDGTHTNTIRRVAHVVDDAVGSRVIIEEEGSELRIDDEYAQRMLSALRDRVTWE
jgi:hypothetical protein